MTDTLDISAIGDTGVTNAGDPVESSIVNSVPTGQVVQAANATGAAPPDGDVDITIVNSGDVSISAIASATNAGGNATGDATIFNYGVGSSVRVPATLSSTSTTVARSRSSL